MRRVSLWRGDLEITSVKINYLLRDNGVLDVDRERALYQVRRALSDLITIDIGRSEYDNIEGFVQRDLI